ncbi:MAG TPA: hypothetical protein VHX66_09695 [Solirubrobacteraceae bacterium]|jgi:hypothetical protein|nr:hypothetical protein [Solirubrobacteraceae bacterium]
MPSDPDLHARELLRVAERVSDFLDRDDMAGALALLATDGDKAAQDDARLGMARERRKIIAKLTR